MMDVRSCSGVIGHVTPTVKQCTSTRVLPSKLLHLHCLLPPKWVIWRPRCCWISLQGSFVTRKISTIENQRNSPEMIQRHLKKIKRTITWEQKSCHLNETNIFFSQWFGSHPIETTVENGVFQAQGSTWKTPLSSLTWHWKNPYVQ